MTLEPGEGRERAAVLSAGRVGRAHGLDGSFYVTRPVERLLRVGTTVLLAGRSAEIVRHAGTEQRPIVRLAGVEDRAAAEALRGQELAVAGEHAPALGDDEWWAHELEGCVVVDGEELLGTVARLIELPSCEALEVRRPDGRDAVIVPMVRDAIRSVSAAERRIEVHLEFLGLRGGDEQGPGGRGTEGRGAGGRGTGGRGTGGRGAEGRGTGGRGAGGRSAGGRGA